jgi:class 3 adenylate cyclase
MRMREAMQSLNRDRGGEDLCLKIGIHEGPCLAVMLNDRQDFFGQTVNIAARVQGLAASQTIFATGRVVDDPQALKVLEAAGLTPLPRRHSLRGVTDEMVLYEIP